MTESDDARLSARLGGELAGPDAAAALDASFAAAVARAREAWPGVAVADPTFATWVAERIPRAPLTPIEALALLHVDDLYLACACADGDAAALATFDRAFLADGRTPDDVLQGLRERLFVRRPDGHPPRIVLYAGRGELSGWVAAAKRRATIDAVRAAREVPTEDALLFAIGVDPDADPELAAQKREARDVLRAAFRAAIAALSEHDRELLLAYYVDRVGVVELGARMGMVASSASRALARIRLRLVAQLRRALVRHGRDAAELESLVELVRSQLTLTALRPR